MRMAVALAPVPLWLAVISALPHKEERFLYVIYPLVRFPFSGASFDSGACTLESRHRELDFSRHHLCSGAAPTRALDQSISKQALRVVDPSNKILRMHVQVCLAAVALAAVPAALRALGGQVLLRRAA